MAIGMGINQLNYNQVVFKRQFRWLFEVAQTIEPLGSSRSVRAWASRCSRPEAQADVVEIKHTVEIVNYPVRVKFQPLDVTFVDIQMSNEIYGWLYSLYALDKGALSYFDSPHGYTVSAPGLSSGGDSFIGNCKRNCFISLFDGKGNQIEEWTLQGAFPESVKFGELDYESNAYATIDVMLRYDRAFQSQFFKTATTP